LLPRWTEEKPQTPIFPNNFHENFSPVSENRMTLIGDLNHENFKISESTYY
jgi:hypothetical protein